MILLLDHDDSFVHTLARYVTQLGHDARVVRDSAIDLAGVTALAPTRIVLSPGPGAPAGCRLALAVVRELGPIIPILGVCLGHQCIGAAYGATVSRATLPRHGMTSPISHDQRGVFGGLPQSFEATRYHSLVIRREDLPEELVVTATATDDGEVMGVRHRVHPVEGVQFHPESVLSEHGHALLANFLRTA